MPTQCVVLQPWLAVIQGMDQFVHVKFAVAQNQKQLPRSSGIGQLFEQCGSRAGGLQVCGLSVRQILISVDLDQRPDDQPQVVEIKLKHECPKVPAHC
jgi:hypothetical protein